jgi:hypothetical protein
MSGMALRGSANKGGRHSKGDRKARTFRLPAEVLEALDSGADAAGYDNTNDYVAELVTRALAAGLAPEPQQDRLPMTA